jgi:hypothetical protein
LIAADFVDAAVNSEGNAEPDVEEELEDDEDDELDKDDDATSSVCCSFKFTLRSKLDGRLRLARDVTLFERCSGMVFLLTLSWPQLAGAGDVVVVVIVTGVASAVATDGTFVAAADVLVVGARSSVN